VKGKTVTHSFATAAEPHKAQLEVATYQQFRELSQELLALNEKICRARPMVEEELTRRKKNDGAAFSRPHPNRRALSRAPAPLAKLESIRQTLSQAIRPLKDAG
jgi:hypothetical protein